MKKLLLLLFIGLSSLNMIGCDDDDNTSNQPVDAESDSKLINATNYSDWVFFSFEQGDTITVADPKTSDAWDLAFKRFYLATNSGSSGNALGGVYNAGKVDLSEVTQAPETGYIADDSIQVYDPAEFAYVNAAGSSALSGWMTFDMTVMPPIPIYSDSIYIIKTATGKYAKIHLDNYYGGDGTKSGMIEFDYVFQPDGSRIFIESN